MCHEQERWGEMLKESVGVRCCENREIMLLSGQSVGRAGKKIIA